MNKYEILYIINASVADEDKEKIVQSVKALVEDNGGSAQEPERWGFANMLIQLTISKKVTMF